jgi:hypothetical protein
LPLDKILVAILACMIDNYRYTLAFLLPSCSGAGNRLSAAGAGFTNFTKFLIRILLSFYHVAQAPRRTLVGLYQHIPTNSVGESGPDNEERRERRNGEGKQNENIK